VQPDPAGGGILVLSDGPTFEKVRRLTEKMDAPEGPQAAVRVFGLKNASAKAVAGMLTRLFGRTAAIRGREAPLVAAPTIVIDEQANKLVIRASPQDQEKIAKLIDSLDAPSGVSRSRPESGIAGRVARRNKVARQAALVEIDGSLKRSAEALAAAKKRTDLDKAEQSGRVALHVLQANKGFLGAGEYRDELARIQTQLDRIAVKREAWRELLAIEKASKKLRVEGQELVPVPSEEKKRLAAEAKVARDLRKAEIPWYQSLRYPKDWEQLTEDRKGFQASAAGESRADAALREKLKREIERLSFADIDFKDVVQFLREYSDANIQVNWRALQAAGIEQNTPVSVDIRKISVRRALDLVLREASGAAAGADGELRYVIGGGVLTISTKADLAREPIRRVYDIRDLIVPVPDFHGPRLDLAEDTGATGRREREREATDMGGIFEDFDRAFAGRAEGEDILKEKLTEDFIKLVRRAIDRDSWLDPEGRGAGVGSIQALNGQLAITQTPDNHRALADLIEKLRRAKAARQLTRKTYDVRDLLAPGGGATGGAKEGGKQREKAAAELLKNVRLAVGSELADVDGDGLLDSGRLVVRATDSGQKVAGELIARLREVGGPQVQVGGNIARQRAAGLGRVQDGTFLGTIQVDFAGGTVARGAEALTQLTARPEFRDFFARNYDWQIGAARDGGFRYDLSLGTYFRALDSSGSMTRDAPGNLAGRLVTNLGQKVGVNSTNIDLGAEAANRLGITFNAGANDVRYAVVDEAQLRTLREVEARRAATGRPVAPNTRFQETIVGTDALLASGQLANLTFAGDTGNTLDYSGNTIVLPHEKYILIDNRGYLTAVRAGEMQHWTEQAKRIEFAEVPQDINVPRVGRLIKLEKTLIKPTDELTIRATYSYKGAPR
ncbi:MAG TPA: secretin N-terminal domain-containing protein, partial [Phycisphaerae bacterium]|nr:secretin N-terminal domain-containing protein [Phycisphaerae bacterium]